MLARLTSRISESAGQRSIRGADALLHSTVLVAFLSGWHRTVTGGLSLGALVAFGLVVGFSFVFGGLFLRFAPVPARCRSSLNVRFLAGYLSLNTLLFALSLASPFAAGVNFAIAGACGLLAVALTRQRSVLPDGSARRAPELLALLVCGVAATLWCRDGLDPFVRDGSNTIIRLWGDSFVHARLISVFMHSHGIGTLSDIRVADTPVYLYHYAGYAIPAVVGAITASGAYEIFASLLLPFGVLLTGLAAFALACSLWGAWPGVAAAAAVVLIPDAYQQGFGNRYLSYNFMQQVNVAGLYGVALAALAWIFVLDACRKGRSASLVLGWVIAALTLAYKAHVFVANAFLVLIYPCLFFRRLAPVWRLAAGAASVAAFAFALSVAGHFERAPTLRLDGSGAATYLPNVAWNYDPGVLGRFFDAAVREHANATPLLFLYGATMLLVSTFGVWLAVVVLAAFSLRKTEHPAVLWFPFFVAVNYLVLSLGLALDDKGIGAADELLNRPLVWAYFAVAAWSGGAAYFRLFGDGVPQSGPARVVLTSLLLLGFAGPFMHAANLQTFPRWGPHFASYKAANSVPACLIAAARFVREKSRPDELIQDSDNDIKFIVAAFAERQAFATFATNRPPDRLLERAWDLAALRRMSDAAEIHRFVADRKIAWYLLRPESEVAWPDSIVATPAFVCGGYRVYRFDR